MTTSRLAIVFSIMLGGMSSVFLLPKQVGFMPVGVRTEDIKTEKGETRERPILPESIGEWWGRPVEVTQHEREVLGADTEFARSQFTNGRGDEILTSIVLAGQDMMTSIHRPERCLRAQGWEFNPGDDRVIDVPGYGKLPVMRLKNHKLVKGRDGAMVPVENVCYYWFAGSRDLTESHLNRVRIDSIDRLTGGYVQRWAMMMVAADVSGKRLKFGRDEKATDEVLVNFIQQLAPQLHKETVRYH